MSRFVADSLLEQAGFEPLVRLRHWCPPRGPNQGIHATRFGTAAFPRRDHKFESALLQQPVLAGGSYNHKTMPDWRVKRHRSVMNCRADHIERNTGENQPH